MIFNIIFHLFLPCAKAALRKGVNSSHRPCGCIATSRNLSNERRNENASKCVQHCQIARALQSKRQLVILDIFKKLAHHLTRWYINNCYDLKINYIIILIVYLTWFYFLLRSFVPVCYSHVRDSAKSLWPSNFGGTQNDTCRWTLYWHQVHINNGWVAKPNKWY
jgi:hypothetical protein